MTPSAPHDLEKKVEDYLLENIPLSKAMGIEVHSAALTQMILKAPFTANSNGHKTAFGGSLHAVATLACWSLLHANIDALFSQPIQNVIVASEIKYLSPIFKDFKASCLRPKEEEWESFLKKFKKLGKAKLKLQANIFEDGKLCVEYLGTFAAINV